MSTFTPATAPGRSSRCLRPHSTRFSPASTEPIWTCASARAGSPRSATRRRWRCGRTAGTASRTSCGLTEHLPDGARVGTVDKFQGQEAPIVFYSMATSSGDDVSRGLSFLFSRNRLNVTVSRAQSLAVIVASPALRRARCTQVEDMRRVNMLCRAAAESQGGR